MVQQKNKEEMKSEGQPKVLANSISIQKIGVAFFIIIGLTTAIWIWLNLIVNLSNI
jgi:hypothetical protein